MTEFLLRHAGIGIADHFTIRVGVGEKQGGVHGQNHAEGRERLVLPAFPLLHSGNQPSQLLGGIDQTLFDQRLVVGQAGDEAAERAFAWHSVAQATDFPELPAAAQPLQQLVVVANLQQELD